MQRTACSLASHSCALLTLLLAPLVSTDATASVPTTLKSAPQLVNAMPQQLDQLTGQSLFWKERLGLKVLQR